MGSLVTLLHCGKWTINRNPLFSGSQNPIRRSPGDRRVLMAGGFATSPAVRGPKRGRSWL